MIFVDLYIVANDGLPERNVSAMVSEETRNQLLQIIGDHGDEIRDSKGELQ